MNSFFTLDGYYVQYNNRIHKAYTIGLTNHSLIQNKFSWLDLENPYTHSIHYHGYHPSYLKESALKFRNKRELILKDRQKLQNAFNRIYPSKLSSSP